MSKLLLMMFLLKAKDVVDPNNIIVNMSDPGTPKTTGLGRDMPRLPKILAHVAKTFVRTLADCSVDVLGRSRGKGIRLARQLHFRVANIPRIPEMFEIRECRSEFGATTPQLRDFKLWVLIIGGIFFSGVDDTAIVRLKKVICVDAINDKLGEFAFGILIGHGQASETPRDVVFWASGWAICPFRFKTIVWLGYSWLSKVPDSSSKRLVLSPLSRPEMERLRFLVRLKHSHH
ncbi:hypothetical protein BKA56DRAFT_621932 [Ilyonectria sp. MPI-CAGE-AT-0026]|nr:hypothetical protein BKA56DRAFT_621932 [Ilyonectria sp. MPI-CAGE-AT-0026]